MWKASMQCVNVGGQNGPCFCTTERDEHYQCLGKLLKVNDKSRDESTKKSRRSGIDLRHLVWHWRRRFRADGNRIFSARCPSNFAVIDLNPDYNAVQYDSVVLLPASQRDLHRVRRLSTTLYWNR